MNKNNNDNCDTCEHKKNPQGGWCYMFEVKPRYECEIHSEEIKEKIRAGWELLAKVAE